MKLIAFTDYSLRVLIYLGMQEGRLATIAEIAEVFQISENHLTKVVHFLGRSGWVASMRGKGGGLTLAMAPDQIGVGQVVRRTEGESIGAECFQADGGHCCIAPACNLRGVLDEAFHAFYAVLDGYTLADLLSNRNDLARLLPGYVPIHMPAARAAAAR